ncbi:MAG: glycosyltransferase family 2 protein [Alphaproteobacteria bacterium]|nr:glycosyltransferase family 2 protein [Alphaproteobacteria bacterium]
MSGRVAVLLATFQGERFLDQQLQSLATQTHRDWVLYWRDDGSSDASVAVMERFAGCHTAGRVRQLPAPEGQIAPLASFMRLLAASLGGETDAEAFAFADQDDVWLPEKLARGLAALASVPAGVPALYCARQVLVDAKLRRLGLSPPLPRAPGFPAPLAQNIATGCTIMLNRAAAAIVAHSRPPPSTLHDWWSYLLVAAAGGKLLLDDTPAVLYRQHAGNLVGAPASLVRRGLGALQRGPGAFMRGFRDHVNALAAHAELLTPQARRDLAAIQQALHGGRWRRIAALRIPGLTRRTWYETLLFRCWFLLG